ncbi:uncharacterized protein LOC111111029 [Crassostrea virginica]
MIHTGNRSFNLRSLWNFHRYLFNLHFMSPTMKLEHYVAVSTCILCVLFIGIYVAINVSVIYTVKCAYPRFGKGCRYTCNCSVHLCQHATGCPSLTSDCPAGFTGKYCDTSCRYPSYGYGCQQRCPCPRSHCHFSTGCNANCIYKSTVRGKIVHKKFLQPATLLP